MEKYQASEWVQRQKSDGHLWQMKGLSRIIKAAYDQGMTVAINMEGELFQVVPNNAKLAAHEIEMPTFHFFKGTERVGAMVAIPENDEDWICDYHLSLESIIDPILDEIMEW